MTPEQRAALRPLATRSTPIRCQECPDVWRSGERWRAYISEERELVFYCPECAEREFESPLWGDELTTG